MNFNEFLEEKGEKTIPVLKYMAAKIGLLMMKGKEPECLEEEYIKKSMELTIEYYEKIKALDEEKTEGIENPEEEPEEPEDLPFFDFDYWQDMQVCMHCKTEEEAIEFCKVMHKAGKKWSSKDSYKNLTGWGIHKEKTCYNFNRGLYDEKAAYFSGGHTILEWSQERERGLKNE